MAELDGQSLQILGLCSLLWIAWPREQANNTANVHPVSTSLGGGWVFRKYSLSFKTGHASSHLLFRILCLHIALICEREIAQGFLRDVAFGLHGAFLA